MFDVADLTRQCRQAASDDVACASDDELLVAVVEFQAARSAMDAAEAKALGELRVRGVTDRCFGLRTAKWAPAQAKVDHRPISHRELLGLRLRHLPVVDAAVADGRIGADHAAVLAEAAANPRVGDQVAATQTIWVELASSTSFVDWKHQVAQTVALLDQDGGHDPNRDRDRNRLRFTSFDDGITRLTGDLVGVGALEVRQLVEAHADRLFHQLKNDEDRTRDLPVPGRATLLAMALADLVRRGSISDRDTTTGPAVDVTLIIEAIKPAPTTPVEAFDPLDPYMLIDRTAITASALSDHCGPSRTPDGDHLHPGTVACLLCDPIITALIVDSLVCRYHHGVSHRRGWTMTAAGEEWFTWTTPSGDTLHSQRQRGRSPTAHPAHQLCPA